MIVVRVQLLIVFLIINALRCRTSQQPIVNTLEKLLHDVSGNIVVLISDLLPDNKRRTPVQQMLIEAAYAQSRGWVYGGAIDVLARDINELSRQKQLARFIFGREMIFNFDQEAALRGWKLPVNVVNSTNDFAYKVVASSQILRAHQMPVESFIAGLPSKVFLRPYSAELGWNFMKLPELDAVMGRMLDELGNSSDRKEYRDQSIFQTSYSRVAIYEEPLYSATDGSAGKESPLMHLIHRILQSDPAAEIHLFADRAEDENHRDVWKEMEEREVIVHRPGEVPDSAILGSMLEADIIVTGGADVSFLPSLMSNNCVVVTPVRMQLGVVKSWITPEEMTRLMIYKSLRVEYHTPHGWGDHDILQQLKLLRSKDMGEPVMVVDMRTDGSGAEIKTLIANAAVAYGKGWLFLGGIRVNSAGNQHHTSVSELADFVFGRDIAFATDAEDALLDSDYRIISIDRNFDEFLELDKRRLRGDVVWMRTTELPMHTNKVDIPAAKFDPKEGQYIEAKNLSQVMSADFLSMMRKHAAAGINNSALFFDPNRPAVAIHLRRGRDVSAEMHLDRYTPDEYYYDLIDRIHRARSDADIHIFSSLEGRTKASSFQGYFDRGIPVHFEDEAPPKVAWMNMIYADLFVMAKSGFSEVPALLNPRCVLHLPRNTELGILDEWVTDDMVTTPYLRRCLGGDHHRKPA